MLTAIYVRVSTNSQAEEGYSLDEQVDKLKKYCEVKGWTVYNVYRDSGFSGSNIERPALSKLISDVKSHKVDNVLVYKLDRLSRSQKDTLYLIESVFNPNKVSFVSLNENFDTSTAFGKAMVGILSVFAQLEREQITERMVMGKVGRAKSGKAMGWSKPLFGYKYVNDTLEIIPIEAMIVKQLYRDYLSGLSVTKVREKLNNEGHIGRNKPWTYRVIRTTLCNPTYTGKVQFQGQLYEGNHEAIIDKKTFDETQAQLELRQKKAYAKSNNPRPFQSKYMLSGIIRCGLCGAKMEVVMRPKKKDGTRRIVYKCYSTSSSKHAEQTRGTDRSPHGCNAPLYVKEILEKAVLDEIEKLRIEPLKIERYTRETDFSEEKQAYKNRMDELDRSLEKLIDLFLDDQLPKDTLQKRKDSILEEKKSLEKKLDSFSKKEMIISSKEAISKLSEVPKSVFDLDYETQVRLVKALINRVTVYPDKLELTWNFSVQK